MEIDQNRPTVTNFNTTDCQNKKNGENGKNKKSVKREKSIEYEYCAGLGDDDDNCDYKENYFNLKKESIGLQKISLNSQNEDGTMLTDNEDTNIPLSNADFMF